MKKTLAAGLAAAVLLIGLRPLMAKDLERTDYKVTIPDDSTIDAAEADIDLDHITTINLPNESTLIFMVIDDKGGAPAAFASLAKTFSAKAGAKEAKTDAFDKFKPARSAVFAGKVNGAKASFEVGQFDGQKKTVIVIFTYLEKEKAETIKMVQTALESFKIKEAAASPKSEK